MSHVTWFGLRWALMLDDATGSATIGPSTVPIGTDSAAVSIQALCAVRALRQAATARFSLMGWSNRDWETAARDAGQLEEALLQAARLNDTADA